MRLIIMLLLTILLSCDKEEGPTAPPIETPEEEVPADLTIKEKAKFNIGSATTTAALKEPAYTSTLKKHFNQVTAEYEMKMAHIWSSSTSYSWDKADELVNFAKENNLEMHGHTLLWYKSFPGWFTSANYDSVSFENKVKTYITAVVSRYKGTAISWDVANEIFNDNGSLRVDDAVYVTFKDPVAFYGRCFQYARDADPAAKLFYNDYRIALSGGKRYAVKQMVERFKREGFPIDGIGDQFHTLVSSGLASMKSGLKDLATTGLLIHISELDIRVNVNKSDNYVFSTSEQQKQADFYKAIVEMFEELPQAQKFAITTWGVTDKNTWLSDWWHPKEYPLLFDKNFQKKKAYDGFLEGLN